MKNLRCALTLLVVCWSGSALAKPATIADFFSACTNPSDVPIHVLTVEPTSRSNGTYPSVAAALQAAKPGDTISLMSGDYGDLALSGMNQEGFITIAAANGQNPKFTSVFIGGYRPASHWRLVGLTVSSLRHMSDKRATGSLVMISNSDNIILERNNLHSQDGTVDWQAQAPALSPPDVVQNGISARQSSCVSIVDNQLRNLFNGIDFGGDQTGNNGKYFLVSGNVIDNFAGDGIDHYGSHVRIENNRIINGHDICNNVCVHNDGIQGWNYNHLPVSNSDVVIDGNRIIAQTIPNQPMPIDNLQGITIFDGQWDNVRVFNNLVITDAWHGISLYGVANGSIVNNTVAPTNPARNTWITAGRGKSDPPGMIVNVVIRNNVFPGVIRRNAPIQPGVTMDHNLALKTADDYADAFVKFDPEHSSYDLHPSRGSPVIGEGSPDGAPATDIEGHARRASTDVGAYAYQEK